MPAPRFHFLLSIGDDPIKLEINHVYTIGRAANCDITINDIQASRRHAELRHEMNSFMLVDLDSRNGTYVNGRRVRERTLRNGDKFRIGSRTFNYLISSEETPTDMFSGKGMSDSSETMDATALLQQQEDGAIMGSLAQFSLPELMQFLLNSARSGMLEIRTDTRVGRFWMDQGQLVDGEMDGQGAEEALMTVAREQKGFFAFQPSDAARHRERTVRTSTANLLLKVCAVLDEEGTRQSQGGS